MAHSTAIKPAPHRGSRSHIPKIPRRVHGIYDYFMGAFIAASPWLFGFTDQYLSINIAAVLGGAMIFYSLLTNYEVGLLQMIPFPGHLLFDTAVGIMLFGAFWHLDMKGVAGVVFGILGAIQIVVVCLTERSSGTATTM